MSAPGPVVAGTPGPDPFQKAALSGYDALF
jgi:hypothetical protein